MRELDYMMLRLLKLSIMLCTIVHAQVGMRYFYDDAGQLFRVLDSTGTLLEYDYDPVGNIAAINRSTVAPASLAVLNMTPLITAAGRTVTIYGQNFSPNAAGNIVTINGVTATVLLASSTTLVVQLGAGTMSGPVSVTVNGVTATSGNLQLSTAVPAITSVTPDSGLSNQSSTIAVTGTHLTGSFFDLSGSGSAINAIVSDDGHATLQAPRSSPGTYAVVATNLSGSSSATVSVANRFTVISEPGSAFFEISVLNQGWISADIPTPGNLNVNSALAPTVSALNQAWIPADIPSPGDLTLNGANAPTVSALNQAWNPANIPSPGDLQVAAGLLVSANNTATTGPSLFDPTFGAKVIGGGSATGPVDLSSVNDGDALIVGQTVRFRLYPPDATFIASDFLVNGVPLPIHSPFEALVTAPAGVPSLDLQAVAYASNGSIWRSPIKRMQVVSDPGRVVNGRALRAGGGTFAPRAATMRVNGLTAEYFQAGSVPQSWHAFSGTPDLRGFVTALNQPDPAMVFGRDPFGTGFAAGYVARYLGEVQALVTGEYQLFLDGPVGERLMIDGQVALETPMGQFVPNATAQVTLEAGWHNIEIDTYQTGSNPALQLSWQQPNGQREVVRPESFATRVLVRAVGDLNGSLQLGPLPSVLNPLDASPIPADNEVHFVLNQNPAEVIH